MVQCIPTPNPPKFPRSKYPESFWLGLWLVELIKQKSGKWHITGDASKCSWCADRLSIIRSHSYLPPLSLWMSVSPLWSFLCVSILSRLSSSPSICVFIRVSSFLITCNSSMPTAGRERERETERERERERERVWECKGLSEITRPEHFFRV